MKTLHIDGRRWFQRSYGNTYNTARIYVDNIHVHTTPEQYGYDDHYMTIAKDWLVENGYLEGITERQALWRFCEEKGIELHYQAVDVKRERDL